MVFSDFCYDPINAIKSVTSSSQTVSEVMNYYLGCTGTNPFASSVAGIQAGAAKMGYTAIAAYQAGYISQACYNTISPDIANVDYNTKVISNNVNSCSVINLQYETFIHNVCVAGFDGLYASWLVHFVLGIELLIFLVYLYHAVVSLRIGLWNAKQIWS